MSLWDKTTNKPKNLTRAQKRNVIATDRGWVRRIVYTDVHSNSRIKDEILVPIGGLANSSNMGFPDIDDIWHSANTFANGAIVNTWVSFNEPIRSNTSLSLVIANTAGGNNMVAYSNTTVYGSNNTLLFRWTPDTAGTYKVQAQTIANTSGLSNLTVISLNTGNESGNLVVSSEVSNNSGTVTLTV